MFKKKYIILICIILIVIGLGIWGYFWYKYRYNRCYEFYRTHRCGLAENECTFKNVVFDSIGCN